MGGTGKLRIEHDDNYVRGCYRIPTVDGDLILCAQVPLYPLRRMLMREFMARCDASGGDGNTAMGFEWNRFVQTGEQSARQMAIKKAARMVNNVVNTPAGQSVVEWADYKVPGLGISVDAARAGFNLVIQARAGDDESRAKLMELSQAAQEGNQTAAVACDALRKMNSIVAENGVNGEAEISGWLWNVPRYSTAGGRIKARDSWFRRIWRTGH